MSIKIVERKCPQNHFCPAVGVCSEGALSQNGFGAPVVDEAKCIDCGKCVKICPKGALKLN
ncbi:MAG TPA: 4Fe-4S ferredoxin [Fibrobacteres bacterium]|nr:4Fe-4S ferredoxin [Fibrobacterota bacterium]